MNLKKKKRKEIRSELHRLIRSVWIPKFRDATDEAFQSFSHDLRGLIEAYLSNIEVCEYYVTCVRSSVYVLCENHVGLGEALDLMSMLIHTTHQCGDESLPMYPILNKALCCINLNTKYFWLFFFLFIHWRFLPFLATNDKNWTNIFQAITVSFFPPCRLLK